MPSACLRLLPEVGDVTWGGCCCSHPCVPLCCLRTHPLRSQVLTQHAGLRAQEYAVKRIVELLKRGVGVSYDVRVPWGWEGGERRGGSASSFDVQAVGSGGQTS